MVRIGLRIDPDDAVAPHIGESSLGRTLMKKYESKSLAEHRTSCWKKIEQSSRNGRRQVR